MAKGISISNSGLDIDQLVTNSMKTYTNKYEQLKKKKTLQEWTKTAYTDLYSSLNKFRNTDLFNFRMQKNLAARKVSSSKDSVVTATAMGGAQNTSHSVRVTNLARNAHLQTVDGARVSSYTKPDGTAGTSVKLSDLADINLTGFDPDDPAQADKVAFSFKISDGTSVSTISYTMKQMNDGVTLNDLASEINKQGLNVTAKYDSTNDSFSIINSKSGSANQVKVTMDASDPAGQSAEKLFTQLQLGEYVGNNTTTTTTLTLGQLAAGIKGEDAKAVIDGRTYTSDKNTFTLDDVIYEFKSVSTDNVTIGVSTDTESLVSTVQKFVDSYNAMLDSINKPIHTARNKNYTPLSDEDKESMTEKEIEKWETQAKTGLLYNDTLLSNLVSNMRNAVSSPISGLTGVTHTNANGDTVTYNSASSIGIAVGDGLDAHKEYGKLYLDTDTLTEALEKDPDIVYKIFATTDNTVDASTGKVDSDKQGFANRLNSLLVTGLSDLTTKAGTSESMTDQSYLGKNINTMATSLAAMLAANQRREEAFYKKYNAMEAAIGNLQSSASSITSLLG